MEPEIWIVFAVLLVTLVTLMLEVTSAEVVFLAAVAAVVVLDVIPLSQALEGFANGTLLALGALFVVAAALRETGALPRVASIVLGSAKSVRLALLRLMIPVSLSSGFVNNTPIVAMGIPTVRTWAQTHSVSSSKLLIPLSYASIFGGMCTLMGTSTNLVSHGLMRSHDLPGLSFFELAWIGVPCMLVGWTYLLLVGPRRIGSDDAEVEPPESEEDEDGTAVPVDSHSVVVRAGSRIAGRRVDVERFREQFNATVRSVRREGDEVAARDLGDIVLRPGDTLMLSTKGDFREIFGDSPEFYVTSEYTATEADTAKEQTTSQAVQTYAVALVILAIVGLAASGVLQIAVAALLGAIALIVGGVISPAKARDAVDWQVLIVIGASLGLGEAVEASGAAEVIGDALVGLGHQLGPTGLLAAVVVGTVVLTEAISNVGAVALFFPIVMSVAASEGLDPRPLIVGMTVAASMSMVTPFGYQTNLMVYSAGDYRYLDFVRAGLLLQLVFIAMVIGLVPVFWPF